MSHTMPTSRVFLSSTSVDLGSYRDRVASLVQHGFGQFAVTMNYFPLEPHKDATSVSLDQLAACQVYILLLAWRYGLVPDGQEGQPLSVTHQEYREARRLDQQRRKAGLLGLPCFVFLADERTKDDVKQFPLEERDPEHAEQLLAFRSEVQQQQLVGYFSTLDDLVDKVTAALHKYLLSIGRLGRVPRDLPPRVPGFVGREQELADLCANLRAGQATELSAALAGLGGVGKSALASEAVRLLAAEPGAFPGGIAFVRCDGQTGLEGLAWVEQRLLDAWDITLSPEQQARAAASAEAEVEVKEQTLRRRLSALLQPPTASQGGKVSDQAADTPLQAGAAALVLLDNVELGLPIDRLLDTLSAVGVTALVTARHLLNSLRVQTQRLETLAQDAARSLFRERYIAACRSVGLHIAATSVNEAAAAEADVVIDALTTLLGFLPLAIELAAARAGRLGLTPAETALELQQARDRGELLVDPRDPTKSLGAVLDKSLTALTERQRLCFAALAQPQGADWPRATIEVFLAQLDIPEVDGQAPAGTSKPTRQGESLAKAEAQAEVRNDLDALVSLSLVSVVMKNLGAGQRDARVRVHPLLRESAQRKWEQLAKRNVTFRERGAVALVHAVRETLLPYTKQAQSYSRLESEEALLENALTRLVTADNSRDSQRLVAQTVEDLSTYLNVGGHWRLGVRLLQTELTAARVLSNRKSEGAIFGNLGLLAYRMGRSAQARHYFEQALAICREVGDRAAEGMALNNLGGVADDLGLRREAHDYYEQALAIQRHVGDHVGEGTTLNNLGLLANTLGQREDARHYFEQALALRRKVGDRAGEGTTLNNLGSLVNTLGETAEAQGYYEQALAIQKQVGNRIGESATLNNLGVLAYELGQKEQARTYFEQALAIAEAIGMSGEEQKLKNNLALLASL